MKKTYSEAELKEKANQTFADYPAAKKVYATVDGNIFLQENRANIHVGPKGMVYPFDRPAEAAAEAKGEQAVYPENAVKTVAKVMQAQSLDELEPFKNDERATVQKAVEKRTAELEKIAGDADKKEQEDNAGTGTNTQE